MPSLKRVLVSNLFLLLTNYFSFLIQCLNGLFNALQVGIDVISNFLNELSGVSLDKLYRLLLISLDVAQMEPRILNYRILLCFEAVDA